MRRLILSAALMLVTLVALLPALTSQPRVVIASEGGDQTRVSTETSEATTTSRTKTEETSETTTTTRTQTGDFSIIVSPSLQIISAGGMVTYAVVVGSINGFDEQVKLAVTGLPDGTHAEFRPEDGKPNFISVLVISTSTNTPEGRHQLTIAASENDISHLATATLIVSGSLGGGTASATADFAISVSPNSIRIQPGESARYVVALSALNGFSGAITLGVAGLPSAISASFEPAVVTVDGVAVAKSDLRLDTRQSILPGTYTFAIQAGSGDLAHSVRTSLIVTGAQTGVRVSVATDKSSYSSGETVSITGSVFSSGDPVTDASISIQVLAGDGTSVHVQLTSTDAKGSYSDSFTLSPDAKGTLIVHVTASKPGFQDGQGQVSFVVGGSETPSILVSSIVTTDPTGKAKTSFTKGDTVLIEVTVQNSGATLDQGLIWIEVDDPNGVPLLVAFVKLKIQQGSPVPATWSLNLGSNAAVGTYKVNALVSDDLISRGGKFLAGSDSTFSVS